MNTLGLSVIFFAAISLSMATVEKRFPADRNGDKFTNVVEKDGFLFVAENRRLHQLDLALTLIKSFNTCASDNCNNINKVLAVSRDLLVLCGTGNNGVCQALNGRKFEYSSSSDSSEGSYLAVSTDIEKTAVGLAFEGDFYLGVTYGQDLGIKTINGKTYKYYISRAQIDTSFTPKASVYLLDKEDSDLPDKEYPVYFKKVFQHDRYIYFLTNQRINLKSTQFVSKLIRICEDENYNARQIKSYTDIVLSCGSNSDSYNLLQDAVFLPAKDVLVAAFSQGDDPGNPTANSAVCVYTMEAVNNAILAAKEDFATCGTKNLSVDKASAYIEFGSPQCLSESEYQTVKEYYICPKVQSGSGSNVIGYTLPLQPNSTYKLDKTKITKVKGIYRYGLYPDVFVGTNTGTISKLSVDNSLQVHMYETNTVIDRGHPITDIYIGEDKAYIVTNRKISSYKNPDCPSLKTCQETLKLKNPSCGWCLAKNKGTKKSDCPHGGWISFLSECVSIDVSPKYIPISKIRTTSLEIEVKHLPVNVTTELRCKFLDGKNQMGGLFPALRNGDTFKCNISSKTEHLEVTVELVAYDGSELFKYAETTIQIYDCGSYTTCGNCLQSSEIKCHWCGTSLTCQDSTPNCANNVTTKSYCSRLESSVVFLPNGITTNVTLPVVNMVSDVDYACVIEQNERVNEVPATKVNNTAVCTLNVSFDMDGAKSIMVLSVSQNISSTKARIENSVNVIVYKCEHLALDCTKCKALNSNLYKCNWYNQTGQCVHLSVCSRIGDCPKPKITKVYPSSGGYKGNTKINITGTDFGTNASTIDNVEVGGEQCKSFEIIPTTGNDVGPTISINDIIVCTIQAKNDVTRIGVKNVTFNLDGAQAGNGEYTFVDPVVSTINPSFGPAIGGTLITLSGTNLGIEMDVPIVRIDVFGFCTDVKKFNKYLTCTTPSASVKNVSSIFLKWNDQLYKSTALFHYFPSPKITEVTTKKSILSGGTKLFANGIGLRSVAKVIITAEYAREKESVTCEPLSDTKMDCNIPKAPSTAEKEMKENLGDKRQRRKRSTVDESISIEITIKMDGYVKKFEIEYFRDPVLESLETTTVFKTGDRRLIITGNYLNLVGGDNDYTVLIGAERCLGIEVTKSNITCIPPAESPNKTADQVEVVVKLGNFVKAVGYVRYEIVSVGATLQNLVIILVPIVGGLLLVGVIAGTIGVCKYRRVKGKAKKFEKNLVDMEMKIKNVLREEFLDMHTTMNRVNENLIEKGFPYNNYQRYTFLMLFPGEWHMDEHPLMHEPVVSKGKVSDSIRFKLKKGMDSFEQLLLNKFFLVSVISTMEKQRKFFLKERSNLAGHLSIALLGKMDYFHEILTLLLTTLIDETPQKQQKTLFRRCESITEKLLSSWLVLSLYPHVKMHSGSPLYMLLKGTQLTMESGPIDAVTGDSKYTLSEEKLLRQDDKHTTLTLKVLVENSDEIRECKVLDCDTISQVKAKCLSQIYVNYPASQLTVDSSELNLEWHWGSGGRLVIKDEDTTTKRDGDWLQLNTLEHYKVMDGSSMALVDPNGPIDQEDYVNLAHIQIDTDVGDGSIHSNEPLTQIDLENGRPVTRWHLVKSDEEKQSTGCVVTNELYLNRLITTKQSVLEYMKNLFDTILNTTIPPPAKFLFDFLDEAGERNKVDSDALHAWKSECYTIRFWATLINKPYNLFDQKIPSYVETSMEVISQVLIESCSLKGHQYTKDSSPGKLIFKNDMITYRDKVKEYYTQVKAADQRPEDLRQYLTDLNHFQSQQTHYNRHSALYNLYCQLRPYMEEILEDLEFNEDTKSLHLDRKLASLNEQMAEE